MKYNRALDGLRAIAVLIVVFFHLGLFPAGWVGVQLFFVLSGYLITGILLRTKETLSTAGYFRRFYWRRTLRIFPVYYLFIGVAFVSYLATKHPPSFPDDWAWLVSYTANFARLRDIDLRSWFTHCWSLSVEEQFYLVWPTVVLLVSRGGLRKLVVVLLVLTPLARLGLALWMEGAGYDQAYIGRVIYSIPISHADAFAAGAAVVVFDLSRARNPRRLFFIGVAVTGLLGGINVVQIHLTQGVDWRNFGYPHYLLGNYRYVWGYTVLNGLSTVTILALHGRNRLGSFLEWRPVVYIGRISYGVYLFHVPILFELERFIPEDRFSPQGLGMVALYLLIVIGVSALSFHLFELKLLRYKDRVT